MVASPEKTPTDPALRRHTGGRTTLRTTSAKSRPSIAPSESSTAMRKLKVVSWLTGASTPLRRPALSSERPGGSAP